MKFVMLTLTTMLVWGSSAFASWSTDGVTPADTQRVSSWMALLNSSYGLDIEAAENVQREELLKQLEVLDNALRGQYELDLPQGTLYTLKCGRPFCGN
ncbi:MAG TPA: hypothetical protein PKC28_06255 [Bdellovibrionales bacterium]|nr:hypothetical protein [Bdellovibrionales bacterium]